MDTFCFTAYRHAHSELDWVNRSGTNMGLRGGGVLIALLYCRLYYVLILEGAPSTPASPA